MHLDAQYKLNENASYLIGSVWNEVIIQSIKSGFAPVSKQNERIVLIEFVSTFLQPHTGQCVRWNKRKESQRVI